MSDPDPPLVKEALANTWAAELIATRDAIDMYETLRPPETAQSSHAQHPAGAERPLPTSDSAEPAAAHADTLDELELPRITFGEEGGELELRGSLGAGGMAVVTRAWQRSLGREVAVKRAREARSQARAMMVREARIAGSLEHPNIVPVHALGRDEHGNAVIVMKRVSGESWRALLQDPSHPLWGEGDRLLRNLEILGQVCRALELAHSRGWLHRDLKSDNVMIGEFGEVYVLDWGIAVPLAIAERGEAVFAGTPACMAPEMAAAGRLTERTDVYLLGGILHEVLTGEPLHQAHTLRALLYAAMTPRARPYPSHAPAELVAIAKRATEYHAEDRFPDVASFRRALSHFIVHRNALELAESAWARLLEVEAGTVDDARAARIEARAALQQSLALWADPENTRAHAGLDRCLRGLIEQELAEGSPAAAAGWAAQLAVRDPELDARIDASASEHSQRTQELNTLRVWAKEQDVHQSAQIRARRALAFAVVVAVLGVGGGVALRAGWMSLGYLELCVIHGVLSSFAMLAIVVGGRDQNRMSRWIGRVMAVAALSPFITMAFTWRLGLPAEASLSLDLLAKAGGAAVMGAFVERSFLGVGVINLLTATALLAFPATYPIEMASAGLLAALILVAASLHRRAPEAAVLAAGSRSEQ